MAIRDPDLVIIGLLEREYLLLPTGQPMLDVPGGDLLYAAAGAAVWRSQPEGTGIGLVGRVGEDYPRAWLHSFEEHGLDVHGIRILASHLDLRSFRAYQDLDTVLRTNPVAHFARLGLPFPKFLLGYQPPSEARDDRKIPDPGSPRPAELPDNYLEARAVHLCPLDYLTTSRFITTFRQAGVTTLTFDPSPAYMVPAALEAVITLLQGLTVFLPSEEEIRSLFWGKTDDLWEMAETLASFGCEAIVIKRGGRGQLLYDGASRKRWEIPAYPALPVDPTGVGDSFCGGFLAGFRETLDPLRAVLHGNVSASLNIEGSGIFHPLETLPGLARARLDSLAEIVRQA